MEAIYPTIVSPIEEHHQYEVIDSPAEDETGVYSYAQVRGYQHQGVKDLRVLYEDATSLAPTAQQKQQNVIRKSPVLPRRGEKPTKLQKATRAVVREDQLQETTDSHYDDVISTTSTDAYVVMHPKLPPSPQRNVSVPQELSALSELSIDDISELSQSKAQLWLLNQMQKLVQKKIEGIHPSEGKRSLFDEARGNQGDYGLHMFIDQHPNLPHAKSTANHDAQGPPVPPRAHRHLQRSREMYGDKHTNLVVQKSPIHQMATGIHPDLYGARLKPQSSGKYNNKNIVEMSFQIISICIQ